MYVHVYADYENHHTKNTSYILQVIPQNEFYNVQGLCLKYQEIKFTNIHFFWGWGIMYSSKNSQGIQETIT